jgi:hypothetical protein
MLDIAYAVHTATCTYLLDAEGVCRATEAPPGARPPPGVERCVGAQFVASLADGNLVGELCVGGALLFARQEGGRFVLLRTLPIELVRTLGADDAPSFAETPVLPATDGRLPAFSLNDDAAVLHPPEAFAPEEELDFEDLMSISVTEVTLMLPLYRVDVAARRPPR